MDIILVIGPMFAGKTTELISRIDRLEIMGKKCVIIRPSKDTRSEELKTHSNIVFKGNVVKVDSLYKLGNDFIMQYDAFGIDECHFFDSKDLLVFIDLIRRLRNKTIIMAMLKSTYELTAFEGYDFLFVFATVIKLKYAVCELCKGKATNTKLRNIDNSNDLVGGIEKYQPCCNNCW